MAMFTRDGDGTWRHDPERGTERRFVCRAGNAFGLPAKDRSGRLDETEPPDLAALLRKINATSSTQGKPMTYDMNDAELPRGTDLIPDGTFVKVMMIIRPGGVDGQGEVDRGLLKRSQAPGSDVLMLDAEFTVIAGPHVRRKFWQNFTVAGGKVDEHGESIGWKISKSTFRAMIDSACGLDPQDMSEDARRHGCCAGWPTLPESFSPPRSASSRRTIPATATTIGWSGSCYREKRNTSGS